MDVIDFLQLLGFSLGGGGVSLFFPKVSECSTYLSVLPHKVTEGRKKKKRKKTEFSVLVRT